MGIAAGYIYQNTRQYGYILRWSQLILDWCTQIPSQGTVQTHLPYPTLQNVQQAWHSAQKCMHSTPRAFKNFQGTFRHKAFHLLTDVASFHRIAQITYIQDLEPIKGHPERIYNRPPTQTLSYSHQIAPTQDRKLPWKEERLYCHHSDVPWPCPGK